MDGTFGVLFLIAGLTDMGLSHCGNDGCLARNDQQARFAISAGDVQFQENSISEEIYVRYELGHAFGPFQPVIGASVTTDGSAWIGFGANWTYQFSPRTYMQLHAMQGLYAEGDGPDLGHVIEFRSGIELGWEARNGVRYGLSYDHRSNAGLDSTNPGMETVQFRVAFPVK